jgi:hypothetical protein
MARRQGFLTAKQIRDLAKDDPPIPSQSIPARTVTPAPRPKQPVAQLNEENNLSGHKWVVISSVPVKSAERERELEADLAKQRQRWVIRDGKLVKAGPTLAEVEKAAEQAARKMIAKLTPAQRQALRKRLADDAEYDELRKSDDDPASRVEGMLARDTGGERAPVEVDFGNGRTMRLDGSERSASLQKGSEERAGYSNIFYAPPTTLGSD